ncbi:MAG: hypothetical protein J5517_00895 [Eubacterium sp.]|nr:hypothetical protein [Eubacterium sp.]
MKIASYKLRKYIALFLTAGMCLGAAACGKTPEIVEEYGGHENAERAAEKASSGEAEIKTSTDTLQDVYGSKVSWNENLSVQGVELKAQAYYMIPDVSGLSAFEMGEMSDFDNEQEFADNFFDDGAKKLEEIKYVNATKYMPLLYKFRSIQRSATYEPPENDIYNFEYERMDIIDSNFKDVYKWVDEPGYFIHMYEGTYNGVPYGLILAYLKKYKEKYIFFNPIDITEYYPGENFLTELQESGENFAGTEVFENKCSMTKDELYEAGREFLKEKIHLTGRENTVTTNYTSYSYSTSVLSTISMMNMSSNINRRTLTALVFSDSNYIDTMNGHNIERSGDFRGITFLGEQDDPVAEYMENNSETLDYFDAFYNVLYSGDGKSEANLTRDGYAVYLGTPFAIDPDDDLYNAGGSNAGMIKFTSKGFYGCDIILGRPIENEIENVELLSFDKIKEAFKEHLEEKLNFEDFGAMPSMLHMDSMYMNYREISDEKTGAVTTVPVWEFYVSAETKIKSAGYSFIAINAMDGSLIEIDTQTFE